MIIGSKLIFYKSLPSTNTHSAFLQKTSGLAEGTIVYTNYQLAGRGQPGNKWESENGKNLLISIILFPSFILPADQFLISMTISLGICDFLGRYIPDSRIKWPNDIYVNNDKIAGLLIENSIMGNQIESTIAGIGLNVNQDAFKSEAPNPVSLKRIIKRDLDLLTCLNELASDTDLRYTQLREGNYDKIKEEYISRLFRLNVWSDYSDKNGIFTGRIIALSEHGNLLIETRSGKTNEYAFKEVEFIL